jgi:DNA-binding MarR family transcriptional regulator
LADRPDDGRGHQTLVEQVAGAAGLDVPGTSGKASEGLEEEPDLALGHNLMRVAKRIERDIETSFARPAGLTFAAFRMMSALTLGGPQSPSELATELSISPASVTSSLNTLERAGLTTRSPQPEDARKLRITLTPEGDRMAEEFLHWLKNEREQRWFGVLAPDEAVVFSHLLRKLGVYQPPVAGAGSRRRGEVDGGKGRRKTRSGR